MARYLAWSQLNIVYVILLLPKAPLSQNVWIGCLYFRKIENSSLGLSSSLFEQVA